MLNKTHTIVSNCTYEFYYYYFLKMYRKFTEQNLFTEQLLNYNHNMVTYNKTSQTNKHKK